jgi:hypothetical protein
MRPGTSVELFANTCCFKMMTSTFFDSIVVGAAHTGLLEALLSR